MDTLRSVAHLQRELGDDLFAAIVSSDHTEAVRKFAQELVESGIPTTMTVAGRTYDILGFLRGDDTSVPGNVMVNRAKEMEAHLGQDDGEHLLAHQDEIPVAFRGKVVFVFTDWRRPGASGSVYCVDWYGDRWVRHWRWLGSGWDGSCRVLRRKSK